MLLALLTLCDSFVRWLMSVEETKQMFVIPIVISSMSFLLHQLQLYMGEFYKWNVRDEYPINHRHTMSCAYKGDHGHLLWRFAYSAYDSLPVSLPNWHAYIMSSIVLFFVKPMHMKIISLFRYVQITVTN